MQCISNKPGHLTVCVCRYKKKIYDLVKDHVESADDVDEVCSPP